MFKKGQQRPRKNEVNLPQTLLDCFLMRLCSFSLFKADRYIRQVHHRQMEISANLLGYYFQTMPSAVNSVSYIPAVLFPLIPGITYSVVSRT